MYDVRAVGPDVEASVAALPFELIAAFTEVRVALEVTPRTVGRPYVARNPSGSRMVTFGPGGRGFVLFAVEDLLSVVWLWQVTVVPDVGQ